MTETGCCSEGQVHCCLFKEVFTCCAQPAPALVLVSAAGSMERKSIICMTDEKNGRALTAINRIYDYGK